MRMPNCRAALDAAVASSLSSRPHWRGASERGRYDLPNMAAASSAVLTQASLCFCFAGSPRN